MCSVNYREEMISRAQEPETHIVLGEIAQIISLKERVEAG